jgi:radical SAM protein with 4Fe4S-binding SPASM domain
LRQAGTFLGKISIHTVISDRIIGRLHELVEYFEAKGIDLLLLCFPWYISAATSREMDVYVQENFQWLIESSAGPHSWDAFKYRVDPANIERLINDLQRVSSRIWTTKVRFQPGLELDEIEGFIRGQAMTARCAQTCKVLSTRVDVTPDGKVSACKFFSEFRVGDLHSQNLSDIWQSPAYERIRATLGRGLSPACSKCNVLYLHDHSTPMHI